jgi:hypothetical protein
VNVKNGEWRNFGVLWGWKGKCGAGRGIMGAGREKGGREKFVFVYTLYI